MDRVCASDVTWSARIRRDASDGCSGAPADAANILRGARITSRIRARGDPRWRQNSRTSRESWRSSSARARAAGRSASAATSTRRAARARSARSTRASTTCRANHGKLIPDHLERLFRCLDEVTKQCPQGCTKRLPLASMIVHLNDDHRLTREQIAEWLTQESERLNS